MYKTPRKILPVGAGYYKRPHLSIGEHDHHLGNITYGGHRRHQYRSTDKIKQINGVTVIKPLLPPFNPSMHAVSTKKASYVRHCKFYLYSIFISGSVCLVTRAYEGSPGIVSMNPAWASFRITSLSHPQTVFLK